MNTITTPMTFKQHAASIKLRSSVFSAEQTAQSAWDAALCAVQAQAFDEHGEPRSAAELLDIISNLHSWKEGA